MHLNNKISSKHNKKDECKIQFLKTVELQPVNCNVSWVWHVEWLSVLLRG